MLSWTKNANCLQFGSSYKRQKFSRVEKFTEQTDIIGKKIILNTNMSDFGTFYHMKQKTGQKLD